MNARRRWRDGELARRFVLRFWLRGLGVPFSNPVGIRIRTGGVEWKRPPHRFHSVGSVNIFLKIIYSNAIALPTIAATGKPGLAFNV